MLDIKKIRENADEVRAGLARKGVDATALDPIIELDGKRRAVLVEVEVLKNKRNVVSKQIGALKKKGEDTTDVQAETRKLGEDIAEFDKQVSEIDSNLEPLMLAIPNIPQKDCPDGVDESDSRFVRDHGAPKTFDFEPKGHVELGEALGIFDFARSTRMTAPGFPLYMGQGARLQRALIQFMLDMHTKEHGYTEVAPPFLCNSASMTGTGQLPKMADDMYQIPSDDLYLVPTAEVPVTNIYREEIIEQTLPICLTAYTPCWRREAGAAGKETRGIIRIHQFDKVEMVKIVEPETSYDELEALLLNAEDVLQKLGLHYRVQELCAGDLSFAAAKCYDIELWAPGQDDWLEVSSCSNFEDFQARRAKIRYKNDAGKTTFVHTLNGSGVALPRLMVAILENGQQADGSISLPEAIVPYMDGVSTIS